MILIVSICLLGIGALFGARRPASARPTARAI
jgi:hypothetical protein